MDMLFSEVNLLAKGFMCPKCKGETATYRHIGARIWCPSCNYVLREEGDMCPYIYKMNSENETHN
jgi:ribosomal protein L37AE/L43A